MSSVGNIFQQTNPYEKFIPQLVELESQTKYRLQAQQEVQRERKTALGSVSSSISKFNSVLKELGENSSTSFQPYRASSSNSNTVRVHATPELSRTSNYNLTVERLAKNDIAHSEAITADGMDLSALGQGSVTLTIGDKTETIQVDTQKDDGEGVMVDMSNQEILDAFTLAVEEAFGDLVQINVFKTDQDHVQLSIQSTATGFENRIQIEDASGALASITDGITHLTPQEELNSRFTIDGITFERGENRVDDVISGLEIELLRVNEDPVRIRTEADINKATENINRFITSFNEMNSTIRDHTFIDAENNKRGTLQSDRSIRNLTINLRQMALLSSSGVEEGQISRLTEIGIGFKNDGSMYAENQALLEEVLRERPDEVAALFTSDTSPVAQMKSLAESYSKANTGVIASMKNGIDQQLDRLDNRIAVQDRHLERFEEQQRTKFNELYSIITQAEDQFNQVMAFQQQLGGMFRR
ncbi:flagellar filament capping protein FliD [Balneolaceae bacterium ANBcel3]|nr:flagellar filament capping protein FliD [Balneolaceae bacterium ANBcel3]